MTASTLSTSASNVCSSVDIQSSDSAFGIRILSNHKAIEEIRSYWEAIQNHPNIEFDFYRLINETRTNVKAPFVLAVTKNASPIALLIGRIENSSVPIKIGYLKLPAFRLRSLDFIYGGCLGSIPEELPRQIFSTLESVYKSLNIDRIAFHGLRLDSPLLAYWRSYSKLRRNWIVEESCHWSMQLPSRSEEVLSQLKSKHRTWIRRNIKRLGDDYDGKVRFESFKSVQDCERLASDAESVAKLTYQRGLGAGFFDDAENRKRLQLAAEKNQLRAFILYVSDAPVAFWIGYVFKGVFHSSSTGYTTTFKDYEVGTTLLVHLLEQLVAEQITAIDFGLGDALYKQRFGTDCWKEMSVFLFPNSIQGTFRNTLSAGSEALNGYLRRLVSRLALADKLKKAWRKRLAQSK